MRRPLFWVALALVFLFASATSAAVNTYSSTPNVVIPDGNSTGVDDVINVPDTGTVNSIEVTVTLHVPILADIIVRLTSPDGMTTATVFNRDGGVGDALVNVTFTDTAGSLPPNFLTNGQCLSNTSYLPDNPLSAFTGTQLQGDWTLTVSDNASPDSPDCDCDPINVGPACSHTLDSWSIRVDYSTNQAPVAQCDDVTVSADSGSCTANASIDDGSYDPDGDTLTFSQDPPGPYPLGDTEVTLTVTDPLGESSSCTATVTVTDDTPPAISCNAPPSITPPDAPVSFTATATDACAAATVEVTDYDCFKFTSKGKRIDKRDSCVVRFSGATFTVLDSGGVGDTIQWTVSADDGNGNTSETTCTMTVLKP